MLIEVTVEKWACYVELSGKYCILVEILI